MNGFLASSADRSSERLFSLLPQALFGPLASPNRERYWGLLCRLYERRFGPDAPLIPIGGVSHRDIVRDVEEVLVDDLEWAPESDEDGDGEAPAGTPLNIQANMIVSRLEKAGWLRSEQFGARIGVTMQPAVGQFLGRLIEFVQTGPVFVAGKIRSIEANLKLALSGEGLDSFQAAATEARGLLEHIRNTGTNVRELMQSFSLEGSPAEYVQRFFGTYVEQVFIGDYRELRTRDHPLAKRQQIMDAVEELDATPDKRANLLKWYIEKRCNGDELRGRRLFHRDIDRLLDLRRIDEYLERLDEEIRRANRTALAFLDYQLRSVRPIDQALLTAFQAVGAARGDVAVPFAPGDLTGETCLAEPRKEMTRVAAGALRSAAVSPQQRAHGRLMLKAREARSVTAPKLAAFVQGQLNGATSMRGDALQLATVSDVRAYQVMLRLGLSFGSRSSYLHREALAEARGFRVVPTESAAQDGRFISGRPILIEARGRGTKAAKEA